MHGDIKSSAPRPRAVLTKGTIAGSYPPPASVYFSCFHQLSVDCRSAAKLREWSSSTPCIASIACENSLGPLADMIVPAAANTSEDAFFRERPHLDVRDL
jgi:hypothetical protein